MEYWSIPRFVWLMFARCQAVLDEMEINKQAAAYAIGGMGFSFLNGIFNFYYVKFFLNIYHIDENWFQLSQFLFLIWNAVNDPLFGYLQDTSPRPWCRIRRLSILYSSLAFCLSFLLPWFPWPSTAPWVTGVHLLLSLCLYDTMFTFIGLAFSALFTEMSTDYRLRVVLVRYSRISHLFSSSAVFFSENFSGNLESLPRFRIFCVGLSAVAFVCLQYSGKYGKCASELKGGIESVMESREEKTSWFQLSVQIFKQKNFVCFVIMNFLQIFHMTASSGFVRIYSEQLIFSKMSVSSTAQSLFYGSYSVIPGLVVIAGTPLLHVFGTYRTMMASFVLKILLGLLMYSIGMESGSLLMAFYIIDNILAHGLFSLFNLLVSDIVDADMEKYKRSSPISSMIYGTNALVTKPAQSLAPMFIVYILNSHGYESLSLTSSPPSSLLTDTHLTMFLLSTMVPVCVGLLQIIAFTPYTLRHSHKMEVLAPAPLNSLDL